MGSASLAVSRGPFQRHPLVLDQGALTVAHCEEFFIEAAQFVPQFRASTGEDHSDAQIKTANRKYAKARSQSVGTWALIARIWAFSGLVNNSPK